ncbi:MAG: hypothetical protein QOH05_560 [Acetobacteraceae bacterium]|jgi:predicted aconitase with swiveling domain|nr:hypothetical protein [Acetobacteraceae bacterium]
MTASGKAGSGATISGATISGATGTGATGATASGSTVFAASAAMGRTVRGQALVAADGFSARYDLDRIAGVFSRPRHSLFGRSYVGMVLILDRAKGGVATAWMLREMAVRGIVPAALVFNTVNPIMVQGAALADATMMSGFDIDITTAVPDGALVEVDAEATPPVLRILRAPRSFAHE